MKKLFFLLPLFILIIGVQMTGAAPKTRDIVPGTLPLPKVPNISGHWAGAGKTLSYRHPQPVQKPPVTSVGLNIIEQYGQLVVGTAMVTFADPPFLFKGLVSGHVTPQNEIFLAGPVKGSGTDASFAIIGKFSQSGSSKKISGTFKGFDTNIGAGTSGEYPNAHVFCGSFELVPDKETK